jgi:peptidoglycan hydrolase FlgJ
MINIFAPAEAGAALERSASTVSGPGLRRGDGVRQVAKQFEAIFLRQMIATMRAPSLSDGIFGSDASNQFRDMADARLADSMAGQFGIATLLEKQLGK